MVQAWGSDFSVQRVPEPPYSMSHLHMLHSLAMPAHVHATYNTATLLAEE